MDELHDDDVRGYVDAPIVWGGIPWAALADLLDSAIAFGGDPFEAELVEARNFALSQEKRITGMQYLDAAIRIAPPTLQARLEAARARILDR